MKWHLGASGVPVTTTLACETPKRLRALGVDVGWTARMKLQGTCAGHPRQRRLRGGARRGDGLLRWLDAPAG